MNPVELLQDPAGAHALDSTHTAALAQLYTVYDPEVGIDIVDLGLVYGLTVDAGVATVDLTMTTPACPLGDYLVGEVENALRGVPGIAAVEVRLVWDPPWGPERMSDDAKTMLGWSRGHITGTQLFLC